MWDAIRQNQRRSLLLIAGLGVLLVGLGALIGIALVPPLDTHYLNPDAAGPGLDPLVSGAWGAGIALALWLVMWALAVGAGDRVLLSVAGAKQIEKHDAPQLWNTVEEMTIASGMGRMPKVYVIDDDAPNAFAVGYRPDRAAVAVTSGLLRRMDRDELQGVVAHEIGHIRNLDVKFMTIAGVMVGTVALIADMFLRSLWYGGGRRSQRSGGRGGGGQAILLLIAILAAILAPLAAQLLYFACSRRREYLADASAARYTRYPAGLASALEKIGQSVGPARGQTHRQANRIVAPMFIVNPLQTRAAFNLAATHPPLDKRIAILRGMAGQAGFAAYEEAFRKVVGARARCLDQQVLAGDSGVAARPPSVTPAERREEAVARARAVGDLLTGLAGFALIACPCGTHLKVPPNFKRSELNCPRCGRTHAVAAATKPSADTRPPLRFKRQGKGWESFRCSCGHAVEVSPAFQAPTTRCGKCGRQIQID
jgi:heat shock protein HtpX